VQPEKAPAGIPEKIRETGADWELCMTKSRAETEALAGRIEIAFGDIPFDLIPRMPRLKWLQLWSAGADILQRYPELKTLPFLMTNTSGIHRQQITEHIFAMILAGTRGLRKVFAAQQRHEWIKQSMGGVTVLAGKTMLILGYGAIGEKTAQAALAFGMKVIGVKRHVQSGEATPGITVLQAERLIEALPQADYVVNILPLTPDTRHSFGSREFAAMKGDAIYVNVGRGATTDESALIDALKTGKIGGALLDVTEIEPLPTESPLWDMDNVTLTPHYAGFHPHYHDLAMEIALENLGHFVRGEPLRNLVDKAAGY
jgi:phosphoglycerate dehydrogenase-like enzyme